MGILDDFTAALRESPGRMLQQQLEDQLKKLMNMNNNIVQNALLGYYNKRQKLLIDIDNVSSEGRIKLGIELQRNARKTFDFNMSEGIALWLTGAWLESMERPGISAMKTHDQLEELINIINNASRVPSSGYIDDDNACDLVANQSSENQEVKIDSNLWERNVEFNPIGFERRVDYEALKLKTSAKDKDMLMSRFVHKK